MKREAYLVEMLTISATIRNFRDLDVWKLGKSICLKIYTLTARFPDNERYGLVAQMRRASVAIPSNVAEGFNRHSNKEERQFLFTALGSCAELETQLEIAAALEYMSSNECQEMLEHLDHESRMLRNLIKKLEARYASRTALHEE